MEGWKEKNQGKPEIHDREKEQTINVQISFLSLSCRHKQSSFGSICNNLESLLEICYLKKLTWKRFMQNQSEVQEIRSREIKETVEKEFIENELQDDSYRGVF